MTTKKVQKIEMIKVGKWEIPKSKIDEYNIYYNGINDCHYGAKSKLYATFAERSHESGIYVSKAYDLFKNLCNEFGIEFSFRKESEYDKFKLAFDIKAELVRKNGWTGN